MSLNSLDELGVYGFTKRSSAAQTVERHLEAGEEKRREATKRLAEQQQKTGDIQKQKEEEQQKADRSLETGDFCRTDRAERRRQEHRVWPNL